MKTKRIRLFSVLLIVGLTFSKPLLIFAEENSDISDRTELTEEIVTLSLEEDKTEDSIDREVLSDVLDTADDASSSLDDQMNTNADSSRVLTGTWKKQMVNGGLI